jgi:hypothetical protein
MTWLRKRPNQMSTSNISGVEHTSSIATELIRRILSRVDNALEVHRGLIKMY